MAAEPTQHATCPWQQVVIERFCKYLQYLKDEAVVGKPMHPLVERIRTDGNEENHEIVRATREKAQDLLQLVSLLIRSVYFAQ